MAMQFDEFIAKIAAAVQAIGPVVDFDGSNDTHHASWSLRDRSATVELVPPLNVSVCLNGSQAPVTTWYPVNDALVPVVSRRIAAYLSEA